MSIEGDSLVGEPSKTTQSKKLPIVASHADILNRLVDDLRLEVVRGISTTSANLGRDLISETLDRVHGAVVVGAHARLFVGLLLALSYVTIASIRCIFGPATSIFCLYRAMALCVCEWYQDTLEVVDRLRLKDFQVTENHLVW